MSFPNGEYIRISSVNYYTTSGSVSVPSGGGYAVADISNYTSVPVTLTLTNVGPPPTYSITEVIPAGATGWSYGGSQENVDVGVTWNI